MSAKTWELDIQGMSCGHCVKAVDEALRSVAGVTAAEVAVGHARVATDETVTREALAAALDEAGYELSPST